MNPWYFQCRSMTARKAPRWFCDSLGIMCPWLVWWMWCWHGNAAERLWGLEGVNILKGRVRVECVEQSHVAAENIREHRRMLRMKFYVTHPVNASFPPNLISFLARLARKWVTNLKVSTWRIPTYCEDEPSSKTDLNRSDLRYATHFWDKTQAEHYKKKILTRVKICCS